MSVDIDLAARVRAMAEQFGGTAEVTRITHPDGWYVRLVVRGEPVEWHVYDLGVGCDYPPPKGVDEHDCNQEFRRVETFHADHDEAARQLGLWLQSILDNGPSEVVDVTVAGRLAARVIRRKT